MAKRKDVNETAAGQSIAAFVVMKGERHAANVTAYYSSSAVYVNVDNFDPANDNIPLDRQYGGASGYGYDKFTAALKGMKVDGITMAGNCQTELDGIKAVKGMPGVWPANWSDELQDYVSYYYAVGLDRLTALGYRVIKVL